MLRFSKAHAYGNDFLYVRADDVESVALDALTQELCDRHTGVGADGLVVYEPTPDGASMRLFNADGGRAEVSGNGVRGLAALLLDGSATRESPAQHSTKPRRITIDTEAGPKSLVRLEVDGTRQLFRAAMGLPRDIRHVTVPIPGETLPLVVMDFGNPQAVWLGVLPEDERFRRIGAAIEKHPLFPEGTNIEFAHVESPESVRILIWERGVGPSLSSGTGSCAALVAAASFAGANRSADVVAPGGTQRVEWLDDNVYLTGWAEVLFSGEWRRQIPRTR